MLKLAGGNWDVPGFTSFWPGGGRWEGPSRVAAGPDILGGHPWQYYDIGNAQAPWIGLEGPRGSLGRTVQIPGQDRPGRVIDVKGRGFGGYGILQRGRYDAKGNLIGGGDSGRIGGGPFQGWEPGAMQQWHQGAGLSQMGYPSFSGNTAGPGGTPLAYSTTSYNDPQYGWVPQAQLANAQASTNPLDYLNPFGHTTQGGAGTGVPTQKAIGTTVGTLSNFIFPGLGFLTGPLARWATNMLQHGVPPQQVRQAVAQKQQQPAPVGGGGASPRGRFDFNVPQGWGGFGQPMGYFGRPAPPRIGEFGAPDPLGAVDPNTGERTRGGTGTFANFGITAADIAASGVNPRYGNPNKSSVPAPGGLGGIYGQGSAGTAGIGSNYDYFGQRSLRALMSGGDTSLGFAGFRNANATPGAPTLPVAQWGGAGFGGTGLPYGTGAVNPDFAARMVR